MRAAARARSALALALALAAALAGCGSAGSGEADPVGTTPIAGWEGKLTTYRLASTIPGLVSRDVTVLVPPGYAEAAAAGTRYPVLYLHDGGNCLDRDPFGHGGWRVHTISYDLTGRGLMAPTIFVLVNNSASRAAEYVPGLGAAPGPSADGYLDFLAADVIPFVERHYRTRPGVASRGLGGSSYGGVISLYGAWTRPATWGFAMAMSTAFAGTFDLAGFTALVNGASSKPALRLYLDSGTVDWSGGDDGQAATETARDLLVARGFVLGEDLLHHVGVGQNHSEEFWRSRLPVALPFLLPP